MLAPIVFWSSGESELLEHQGLIPLLPALLHPTVRHWVHDEAIDGDRFARRRRGAERSRVRSAGSPPKGHAIALDQLIFDREVKVGSASSSWLPSA